MALALLAPVRTSASSLGGAVLAAATRSLAAVRPTAKPLHPDGLVMAGRLFRTGLSEPTGSPWLDEPGEDDVVVRISRAIGLPAALPDIHGLALRVPVEGGAGHGDLLFAQTGWGRWSRFVLTAGKDECARPMTTLLPYRTTSGPLLLGARCTGTETFEISCAPYDGDWRHVADLRISSVPADDQAVTFDAVRHQVPGLEQYPAVERLRAPAYAQARASRGD
jgi:hypothetical protein